MKIISYNIHKGFNLTGTRYTFDSLKDFLIQSNSDIVFLQECAGELRSRLRNRHKGPFVEQLESLADTIWTDFAYGKNAVFDDGHHGNAILTKHPILEWENIDLSLSRFEKRGLLRAKIEIQNKNIHLFCTHLNLRAKDRKKQMKLIENAFSNIPPDDCIIFGGDLNDWSLELEKSFTQELLLESPFDSHPKTYPSFFPFLSLDRIYFRGLEPKAAWVEKPPGEQHSDHLPVFAEFFEIGKQR